MNLTLDQYLNGLERSVRELPAVLLEWDDIEPDLQDEYVDQLTWMLHVRPDVARRAEQEGRYLDVMQRINAATSAMFHMREQLREKMSVSVDRIVPYTAYAATDCDSNFAMAV